MADSAHAINIYGTTNRAVGHFPDSNAVTTYGIWELSVRNVAFLAARVSTLDLVALECNLVNQLQKTKTGQLVLRPATLEVFKAKPGDLLLYQPASQVWFEITAPSSTVEFTFRDYMTDSVIEELVDVVIHLLYRRKR